ncbi:GM13242 [Drosophila sechellia]|uniref:GM13242 n=1 Tax=Drosophila sechellia TaxID=7238 RepID=B4IL89_DROSE|nr:GM13242 [Drosophila sechellia]
MEVHVKWKKISGPPNIPHLGELRSLRSLSLSSNHLLYLPRKLTCLSLISLDVSNNKIASLPLEIQLENKPLTSPPASATKDHQEIPVKWQLR